MRKYTIAEYAREKGVTERSVRYQVERGKLLTRKETINNRETTIIVADELEQSMLQAERVTERHISDFQQESEILTEENGTFEKSMNLTECDLRNDTLNVFKQMYDDNIKLINKIQLLSELAGQAKLLTDSEHRTKQEYFQIFQEKTELKLKLEQAQEKIKELELKQQSRNWWRKL